MTHSLDIPAKAGTIQYAAKKNGALPVWPDIYCFSRLTNFQAEGRRRTAIAIFSKSPITKG